MKKPLLQFLTFAFVFLVIGIGSSFSQQRERAVPGVNTAKNAKSNITYIDSYIQQPNVDSCLLVSVLFEVEDEKGIPITDAIISFDGLVNAPGDYIFDGIESGSYDYSVSKEGYESVNDVLSVSLENSIFTVRITMVVETFTVIFNIMDEDDIEITDAAVTFNGKENNAGNYIFSGIEAGTYDFKVERKGYISMEGQQIIDGDTTINLNLESMIFTVSFIVRDEGETGIDDAVITFNDVENDAGNYIFEGIKTGIYDYKIEREGYSSIDGQHSVIEDTTINITLLTETFTIKFNILDEKDGEINDAVVTFDSMENDAGNYIFTDIKPGTYDYNVERPGYISRSGQHSVSRDDTLIVYLLAETFTITFIIIDEDDNEIADAVVTFNGMENNVGDYVFEGIKPGTYAYSAERYGYDAAGGQHSVSSDTSISVTLLMKTYNVTFNITGKDDIEISDAIVIFDGVENNTGEYTFEGIKTGNYYYKVAKEGYHDFEGQAEVSDQDLNILVQLSDSTTTTVDLMPGKWISLVPNPNTGKFTLELSLIPSESKIRITVLDPTGRVVHMEQEDPKGETFKKELNLSFLSRGIYFIHVQGTQQTGVGKLIIN